MGRGVYPLGRGVFPLGRGVYPLDRGSNRWVEGSNRWVEGSTPWVEGSTPWVEGSTPWIEGSTPWVEVSTRRVEAPTRRGHDAELPEVPHELRDGPRSRLRLPGGTRLPPCFDRRCRPCRLRTSTDDPGSGSNRRVLGSTGSHRVPGDARLRDAPSIERLFEPLPSRSCPGPGRFRLRPGRDERQALLLLLTPARPRRRRGSSPQARAPCRSQGGRAQE